MSAQSHTNRSGYEVVDPSTQRRVSGPFTTWNAAERERVSLQIRWAQGYSVRPLASDEGRAA